MNKTKLASLFCLLVSVSVGCLPYPHAQHDYPEISGELVGPSGPLEGVRLALLHNAETDSCENPDQVVLTTRDGTLQVCAQARIPASDGLWRSFRSMVTLHNDSWKRRILA